MRIGLLKETVEKFYLPKRLRLYFAVFLSLFASIFEYLGLFLIFQFILVISSPNTPSINFFLKLFPSIQENKISLILGISIALIYIFKNIYMYFYTKIINFVLQDIALNINLKVVKRFLYSDFVLINSIPSSEKNGIITKTNIIVWSYINQYLNLIVNSAIIIALLAFLFIKFTLCAVVSVCFLGVLTLIEYKILRHKSNYQNKYYALYLDALNKTIYKIINAIKEIRLNNKSGYYLTSAHKDFKNYASINRYSAQNSVFHIYFTEISIMATFILILLILYFTTNFNNQTVITSLGTIIAVILRINPAINRLQSALYGINSNEKIVCDLLDFEKRFNEEEDIYETDEKLPFEKEIKLENISYNYPNNKSGLENINLSIKKGEFIGIVGHSGCYKTTLSLIIAGLIKANGNIYVDDTLLKDRLFKKWQNNISILSQEFSLLNDNIFEGLDDEIIEKLDLKDFNSNPNDLSTGQKQRVALAQNIILNKEVLILDEATSSLDVISEDKINEILLELKGKKTIISIAHRLQILKNCDKIIYMDNAKIIDIDTFKNLNDKYDEFKKIIELSDFKL